MSTPLSTPAAQGTVAGSAGEDPRWQKLRDLLGLDGWHEGHFHGLPNPDQIIAHVQHVANERARLMFASEPAGDGVQDEPERTEEYGPETEAVIRRNGFFINVEWWRFGRKLSARVYEPQMMRLSPALADVLALALEDRPTAASLSSPASPSPEALPASGVEAVSLLRRLAPYLDAIVCYASTTTEHEPNAIVRDVHNFLTSAPAPEPSGSGVRVKPLEWHKPNGGGTLSRADTIIGVARVWTHHEANGAWFWSIENHASGQEANETDAKKMLWATYEHRILSALASDASPRGEGLLIDRERLREKIAADPDLEYEVRPAHPAPATVEMREEAAQAALARIRKLRDEYADQAKFAYVDEAHLFRQFVERLDRAALAPATEGRKG